MDALRKGKAAIRKEVEDEKNTIEHLNSLGLMTTGIAHEINTPIGAVSSMHDTLKRAVAKLKETLETQYPEELQKNRGLTAPLKIIEDAIVSIEKTYGKGSIMKLGDGIVNDEDTDIDNDGVDNDSDATPGGDGTDTDGDSGAAASRISRWRRTSDRITHWPLYIHRRCAG